MRLVWGYSCALHRTELWPAQTVATQPEQDLGGFDRLGRGKRTGWARGGLRGSSALQPGQYGASHPRASMAVDSARDHYQRGCAVGRSAGVGHQAQRGRKGLGNDAAGARWHTRPHRRAAARHTRAVVRAAAPGGAQPGTVLAETHPANQAVIVPEIRVLRESVDALRTDLKASDER